MCIVHATKIGGHPEGESALGTSVACWKAACWRQAKDGYNLNKLLKLSVYNEGVLCSYLYMPLKALTGIKRASPLPLERWCLRIGK